MESIRIASTPLAGLSPLGQAAARDHGRVTASLAKLSRDAAGRLALAEPEPSRDGKRVDWYAPGGKSYVALAALPAEEKAALLARIDDLLAGLRREGERLQAAGDPEGATLGTALTLPEPRENYIHIARDFGDPEGWQAVLVCWGHANDSPTFAGAVPQVMARPGLPPPFVVPAGREAVLGSAPALAAPLAGTTSRRWWLLLWLALLALLLIIAWMMLRACGMGLPAYGLLHHVGLAFCPGTALAASAADLERSRTLTDLAHDLQLQVEQRKVECLAEQTPPPPQDPPKSSIAERLEREGAKTGELQVSLAWDGPADLDLHVICPNGETIYFSQRTGCGGKLDVDMNSEKKSLTPVENVYWPDGKAATGQYKVQVVLYNRLGDTRPSIPFQVRIKTGGAEQVVPGSVSTVGAAVPVTEFVR